MTTSSDGLHAGPATDVVLDVDHLAGLFVRRAGSRARSRQCELPMLERTLRKHVAQRLLTHVVPALLGELLEAAADDLSPTTADDPLSELESQADADLRTVESVERCKAALDAAGLREKDGAPPSPSLFRQRLTRASLAADREAVSAGVRHDAAAAVHTHRSTATGSEP